MSNYSQQIPHELLWMIVDHVDDRQTLYALLTTCKTMFHAAARKLWTDPFGYEFESEQDFLRLLKYVLALSPSRHPAVVALRKKYKVTSPPRRRPYVDYLGFIRHARPQQDYFWDSSEATCQKIIHALPWIICNGRFKKLSTFIALPHDVEIYLKKVSSMTQLTRIVWAMGFSKVQAALWQIRRFVTAYVAAHGERGRQLQMEFDGCEHGDFLEVFSEFRTEVVDIFRLLAPFPPGKRIIDGLDDWVRCVAHKDDMDFGHVWKLSTEVDEHLQGILAHCLALQELELWTTVKASILFDPFSELASLQAHHHHHHHHPKNVPDPRKTPLSHTPPLRSVHLFIATHELWLFMQNLAEYFGTTLEDIRLDIGGDDLITDAYDGTQNDEQHFSFLEDGSIVAHLHTRRWAFPVLRHLALYHSRATAAPPPAEAGGNGRGHVHFVVHGSMRRMPKLQELSILGSPPTSKPKALTLSTSTTWKLPELRELKLAESVAIQFNPKSLARSPKLEYLVLDASPLFLRSTSMPALLLSLRSNWVKAVQASSSTTTTVATRLSSLTQVTLRGAATQSLDLCTVGQLMPALESLRVDVGSKRLGRRWFPSFREFVVGKKRDRAPADQGLDGGGDDDDDGGGSAVVVAETRLKNLQDLIVDGHWRLGTKDYRKLLEKGLVPRLRSLEIEYLSLELLGRLVSAACRHPSLRRVHVGSLGEQVDSSKVEGILKGLGIEQSEPEADSDADSGSEVAEVVVLERDIVVFLLPFARGFKRRSVP